MRFSLHGCLASAALTLATLAPISMAAITPRASDTSNSPMVAASKAVQDAQTALTKVQADVTRIRNKAKAQLMTKPEWAPVSQDLTKAQTDLANAKKAAMDAVVNKPEYKALVTQRSEAQKIRQQAQAATVAGSDDAKVSDADLQKADSDFISAGLAMKAMEKQALVDDQAYNDAKARVDAANAKLAQLDAEIDEVLKTDTEYTTIQPQLLTAQQAVTTAKEQLVTAREQVAQQRASEAKSRQSSRSTGSSTGGR